MEPEIVQNLHNAPFLHKKLAKTVQNLHGLPSGNETARTSATNPLASNCLETTGHRGFG